MPISIDGAGVITGLSGGGLPDGSIHTADIADSAITTAKIAAGAVIPADLSQPLTQATAQNTTSGSTIDFTDIPSWVKRITVSFSGLSTTGASGNFPQIRLGTSAGVQATGYTGFTWLGNTNNSGHSTGFLLTASGYNTSQSLYGHAVLTLLIGTTWVFSTMSGNVTGGTAAVGGGGTTLSSTLTTVRLTTGGSDTFDSGTINLMYEG